MCSVAATAWLGALGVGFGPGLPPLPGRVRCPSPEERVRWLFPGLSSFGGPCPPVGLFLDSLSMSVRGFVVCGLLPSQPPSSEHYPRALGQSSKTSPPEQEQSKTNKRAIPNVMCPNSERAIKTLFSMHSPFPFPVHRAYGSGNYPCPL